MLGYLVYSKTSEHVMNRKCRSAHEPTWRMCLWNCNGLATVAGPLSRAGVDVNDRLLDSTSPEGRAPASIISGLVWLSSGTCTHGWCCLPNASTNREPDVYCVSAT